ncbi:hypothetical protein E1176_02265 [Fulvivirga sp. RKSG066]|uniref:TolB family protein n=1 Tax=Fulvivirga aurantia TaxID=2529383 RepID=UPI0012BCE741|nr:PD40 domain-containing protein [Fulvivirga aurantia]MTI19838.1 hypothetical protein [Fulvivirga aurantia]
MKYILILILQTALTVSPFAQEPKLLLPVSTALPNRDITISPTGDLLLTTVQSYKREVSAIIIYEKSKNSWSNPQTAPFSGTHSDLEPAFSPDGKTLYFASNRPLPDKAERSDYNIWAVKKTPEGWSTPYPLPEIINTSTNEFYPSVTNDGSIYYTATYENGKGKEDIYVSRLVDGEYQSPESLSEAINTDKYEFNAFVATDESYIVFSSYGREDDLGGGDLYISYKNDQNQWQPAQHLSERINSKTLDYCPFVDQDGRFYFTSSRALFEPSMSYQTLSQLHNTVENGLENIYFIAFSEIIDKE